MAKVRVIRLICESEGIEFIDCSWTLDSFLLVLVAGTTLGLDEFVRPDTCSLVRRHESDAPVDFFFADFGGID